MTTQFSLEERKYLLSVAREAIDSAVRGRKHVKTDAVPGKFKFDSGVFVTIWQRKELRGCIGYIEADAPLVDTLREVAGKAAMQDPRFAPVTVSELDSLDIEISVLTPPVRIRTIDDIEIGRDGLIVQSGGRRGLLLPQVPVEYGWDRLTFVTQTCRKAGLPADSWKSDTTRLMTFTAVVFRESECGIPENL
jgi:AmmeMemoRadiSam system protein A